MRNIQRKDIAKAWDGTDRLNENNTGGLAVWDIPSSVHNAFNPVIFTRTRYMHLVAVYVPEQKQKPNYVSINSSDISIEFMYATKSPLYLTLTTDRGVLNVMVYSDSTVWRLSNLCSRIDSVDAIGLTLESKSDAPVKDTSYIYLLPGAEYEDENYICDGKDRILYKSLDVETATLRITHGTESVTLSAESYGGVIKFDVSQILRSWFNGSFSDFPEGTALMKDEALYCDYRTTDIGGETLQFLAVNAVAQIGETADRSDDGGCVLTRFESLRQYPGYQLDYALLATSEDVETAMGTATAGAVWRVLVSGAGHLLQDGDGVNIQNEESRNITLAVKFNKRIFYLCVPERPFYVRWLNMLGGVDYFMFSRQQKISPSVKSSSTYAPFIENPETADSNIKPYTLTTENTVTVGAEGLSSSDFLAISEMPFSPLIEWWSEKLSRWVRLSVSKFDGTHYTRPETKSVEISFTLPDINTQF